MQVIRWIALLVLVAAGSGVARGQPLRCDRLAGAVVALNQSQPAPALLLAEARRARRCYGRQRSALAAAMFQAEAWALLNTDDWEPLAALADTFVALGYTFRTARAPYVQVLRQAGVAKVMLGRVSEGLAQQRGLAPLVAQAPPRQAAEFHADLARSYLALDDLPAAAEAWRQNLAAAHRLDEPERSALVLRASLNLVSIGLRPHEDGLPLAPDTLQRLLRRAEQADTMALRRRDREVYSETLRERVRALLALGRTADASALLRARMPTAEAVYRPELLLLEGHLAARERRWPQAFHAYQQAIDASDVPGQIAPTLALAEAYEQSGALDRAEDTYRRALVLDAARERAGGADEAAMLRRSDAQRAVRGLVRVLVEQGRVAEAFALQDGHRARLLTVYRVRAQQRGQRGETARLLDALAAARDSVRRDEAHRSVHTARVLALQGRLARLLALPEPQPTDVRAVQRQLRASGRVLVAYSLDPGTPASIRAPRSVAFVVTPDTVRAVPLAISHSDASTLVGQISPVFTSLTRGREQGFDLRSLHELHSRLIAPLRLPPTAPLLILPDGPLFALPFGALVTQPVPRFGYDRARFLVEDRALSVDIAAALRLDAAAPQSPGRLLVLARSDYRAAQLPNLPSVDDERRFLSRWPNAEVYADEASDETRFAAAAPHAQLLHLAAHTDVSARSPLDYAFRFWPTASSDGRLSLFELLQTPLSADLAVLSGCSTARGESHAGEGMLGLQYGVRAAGARSVVATHWVADDASTGRIVTAFYQGLRDGLPRDEALRRAQLAFLNDAEGAMRSPFYWAAPVLYGETGPVALPKKHAERFWAGAFAVVAAFVLAYLRFLRPSYVR